MSTRLDVTGYGAEDTERLRLGAVEATRGGRIPDIPPRRAIRPV